MQVRIKGNFKLTNMFANRALSAPLNKTVSNMEEHIKESLVYKQTNSSSITFDYELNGKATKLKLIKAAKRTNLEIEENSTSTNLVFSAGAWAHTVLPTVKFWSEIQGVQSLKIDDYEISVGGVKTGKEASGKHVNTQVIFYGNRDKIVLHLYNTTQLILVNGHGYKKFIDLFLKPFFILKTNQCLEEIGSFNVEVIDKLGPKTVKRSDIKYKRGTIFSCSGCDFTAKSISSLKSHKITQHTLSLNSPKPLVAENQPVENTSVVEMMMLEDASVSGLTDDDDIEEIPLKYTCFDCQFVTTSKTKIDDHVTDKHATEPNEEVRFLCTNCEQVFTVEEDYDSHAKSHEISTGNTDIEANGLKELLNKVLMDIIEHDIDNQKQSENSLYEPEVLIKCKRCDYTSNHESDIKIHTQTLHTEVRINIESGNTIKCNKCQFTCKYNIQMKKHMKSIHPNTVFECNQCDFEAMGIDDLWKHKLHTHESETLDFDTEKDVSKFEMLFNLIKEQNGTMHQEINKLKSYLGEVFDHFANLMEDSFKAHKDDNESKHDNIKKVLATIKADKIDNNLHEMSSSPLSSSSVPRSSSPRKEPKQKSNIKQAKRTTPYLNKPNVLLVGDSLSQNLHFRRIETITNTTIKTAKAYSSVWDERAKFKHLNINDVSRDELKKKQFDHLILAAPTVDISNLKTDRIKPDDDTDDFKNMVKDSCNNMLKVAEDALSNNSELKSVTIMNHAPRRDSEKVDPMGIKSKLASFANHYLLELWLDSPQKHNITIGSHSLESSEETLLIRQTDEHTGKYDGIHFYGNSGKIAYTESVINILISSLNINPKYQRKPTIHSPSTDTDDHTNCPQTQYMKMQRKKVNRTYSSVVSQQPIQTKNRFSPLYDSEN